MAARTTTDALREVAIFAGLSDDALARVADAVTEVDIPAGSVLVEAKMAGSGLFIIEQGTVVVDMHDEHLELGPGEVVGELALLTPDAVRTARVRAKTDVRVIAVGREAFRSVLMTEPTIAVAMLETLAARLHHA